MRTLLLTLALIITTSLLGAAADPTAIIHTTAGDLHCTLLPKVAPIGVENFIGLANGTKDWTSPISHEKKHGVPLYDGTIFHRVIPQFMIQGGDPAGNGTGDPAATSSRMRPLSPSPSIAPGVLPTPTPDPAPTARSSSSPKFPTPASMAAIPFLVNAMTPLSS